MGFPTNLLNHLRAIGTGLKYLIPRRLTLMYPEYVEKLPEGYRGYLRYDIMKCIHCSLCARICPANAIKMYRGEDKKLRPGINYTRCIFCGFCADICPTGALEYTNIQDIAYESLEDQIYPPERFSKGVPRPVYFKKPVFIIAKIDEERGLRYDRI